MTPTAAAPSRSVLRVFQADDPAVAALISSGSVFDTATEKRTARIVGDVRRDRDAALLRYARTLDRLEGPIELPRGEWSARADRVDPALRRAIGRAAANIRKVARAQVPRRWAVHIVPGVTVAQEVLPLERVGCYVPGGRFPLPSSLLMTAIPARVAGVREVIAVCPRVDDVVVAAAVEARIDRLFRIGGAHAVAALAYGTATVPRVDKIVGPGNRWVSAAKALVSRDCAIDFYAGPSEIVIVSTTGPATWIAADLIAQAEHDPDARAIFITSSVKLAEAVAEQVNRSSLEHGAAEQALRERGGVIVTRSMDEAMTLSNRIAPEHLVLGHERLLKQVRAAGAVFIGPWTAQVGGDYAFGSNHVLPTAGAARARGGLSAADYVRTVSVQRATASGLAGIAETITTLARAEGLHAHAASIDARVSPTSSRAKRVPRERARHASARAIAS